MKNELLIQMENFIEIQDDLVNKLSRSAKEFNEIYLSINENMSNQSHRDLIKQIKANAVIEFAEMIKGAYLSGFVISGLTVYDVYQSARNHVMDNYGLDTAPWDDDLAAELRGISE